LLIQQLVATAQAVIIVCWLFAGWLQIKVLTAITVIDKK